MRPGKSIEHMKKGRCSWNLSVIGKTLSQHLVPGWWWRGSKHSRANSDRFQRKRIKLLERPARGDPQNPQDLKIISHPSNACDSFSWSWHYQQTLLYNVLNQSQFSVHFITHNFISICMYGLFWLLQTCGESFMWTALLEIYLLRKRDVFSNYFPRCRTIIKSL